MSHSGSVKLEDQTPTLNFVTTAFGIFKMYLSRGIMARAKVYFQLFLRHNLDQD